MKLQTPYPSAANLALAQSSLNHTKLPDIADWTIEGAKESSFIWIPFAYPSW